MELTIDMYNSLQHQAKILYKEEEALLIQDVHSCIYYSMTTSQDGARRMMKHIPCGAALLVTHDVFSKEEIASDKKWHYEDGCHLYKYPSTKQIPISLPLGYTLKMIHEEYMEEVIKLYSEQMPELANETYIKLCMDGGMLAILEENQLCAFISVHEGGYGSIGMLEVKQSYRRRGFGQLLEQAMINEQLRRGNIPYGEIFYGNQASLLLQKKVGMCPCGYSYWFYNEEND